jgi:SAM-dependent methyltransferase
VILFVYILLAPALLLAESGSAVAPSSCDRFAKISKLRFSIPNAGTGAVNITRGDGANAVRTSFAVTNHRSLRYFLSTTRSPAFYDLNRLRGLRILDVGSGSDGAFVRDLREQGIDAYGIDLVAPFSRNAGGLVQGDAMQLPFQTQSFDHVYSSFSIFFSMYIKPETRPVRLAALREIHRVLKPDGSLRLDNIDQESGREIRELLKIFPGFRISTQTGRSSFELERIELP